MSLVKTFRAALYASCTVLLLTLAGADAQTAPEYKPQLGQQGKDVIWLPTHQALVDRMLEMARVTPDDYLVDLGSGDGRTVITAAKRGVRALGVEHNPDLVALSKRAAAQEGVEDKATFVEGDIFETDFSKASVVTLFLLPQLNLRLRPTLLNMKPGTRVVSNSFDMGEWTPDERVEAGGDCTSYCRAFLWIIPAKVEGSWRFPEGELVLEQSYQMVSGTITLDGKKHPITDGRLAGNVLSFSAGDRSYSALIDGESMRIEPARGDQKTTWTARRQT
jgi:hypothetical protein